MMTIEQSLEAWVGLMRAEEYSNTDIMFALAAQTKRFENSELVDEARELFGEKAAGELAEKLSAR